ncbi:MAG: acyltransferase, partial [Mesorhizobium sp.]
LGLGIVGDMTLRGDQVTGFGTGSPWVGFAAIMAMLIAVIVASWFTWRFVEMPALAWVRRLSKRI